ncbi:MAG: peptidase [Gammaproteobacteria bacterium]|nr:peptidase [Gammaproteobacteria bacterium]
MNKLSLLLAATIVSAPVIPVLAAPLQADPARLSVDVKLLSSDAFEGREPATRAENRTVLFIIDRMKEAGLQPGGTVVDGRRGWTQDVPLAKFAIAGPLSLSLTVGGRSLTLAQGQQVAIRAAQTNVDQVAIQNAPLVFVGYGVAAPERKWDDFKGVDLHGKIAVVLVNDPDFATGTGDFGGKAMTYYGRWTYKYEEAARRGALGMLIVHDTAAASYGWATVVNSNTDAIYDIVRNDPSQAHVQMEGWIQHDAAAALFKQAGLDFDALKKLAQTRDFKPVTLGNVTLSAAYRVNHDVVKSQNVLGRLPGATKPDETLIYSAHWDHFGVRPPDANGDRILNGAVDNGTGVAALLELGRLFGSAPRTARSIVFMAVTAEERGLLGSEYYATDPVYPLETTVADINMDMLGVYGPTKDVSTFGKAENTLLDDLVELARAQGRSYSADPSPEAGHFFRSDHFSLSKRGVPAMSFSAGDDLVNGGASAGRARREDYNAHRYHQPGDEWTPNMDFRGEALDVTLLYGLGRKLATSGWPQWSAGSEFKEIREKSANQRH